MTSRQIEFCIPAAAGSYFVIRHFFAEGGPVSLNSSFDAKEQVRQAIDIVDLVGQYLQLRREGRIYKALCPWHDDTRPSLQVNPERQSFKCWVCNIGGDIFSFMMKIENVEFPEALAMLAECGGHKGSGFRIQGSGAKAQPRPAGRGRRVGDLSPPMMWRFNRTQRQTSLVSRHGMGGRTISSLPHRVARGGSRAAVLRRTRFDRRNNHQIQAWICARTVGLAFGSRPRRRFQRTSAGPHWTCAAAPNGGGHYDWFRGRVLFPIRDCKAAR